MPGHTFLYSPPVIAIRDLIESGELGEIYFVSTSRVNLGLHQPDVSVVWDLAPHDFSILRYWLDETPTARQRDQPRLHHPAIPDVAFIDLEFASRDDRARRALVARAEQAAPDDDRRLARRWSSTTTRATSRSGSSTPASMLQDPETFGEYRSPTGRATSSRRASRRPSRCPLEMEDFCAAIRKGVAHARRASGSRSSG